MSTLKKVTPLSDTPEFVAAFTNVVYESRNKVCSVCGLGRMGHGPESLWLGYAPHEWQGVPATPEQVVQSERLTIEAYANRPHPCGHRYASYKCRTNCIHPEGHCIHCAH